MLQNAVESLGYGLGISLFIIFFFDIFMDTVKKNLIYFGSVMGASTIGGLIASLHSNEAVSYGAVGVGVLVAFIGYQAVYKS